MRVCHLRRDAVSAQSDGRSVVLFEQFQQQQFVLVAVVFVEFELLQQFVVEFVVQIFVEFVIELLVQFVIEFFVELFIQLVQQFLFQFAVFSLAKAGARIRGFRFPGLRGVA